MIFITIALQFRYGDWHLYYWSYWHGTSLIWVHLMVTSCLSATDRNKHAVQSGCIWLGQWLRGNVY